MKSVRSKLFFGLGALIVALLVLAFVNWAEGSRVLEANSRAYVGGIEATRALGEAATELETIRAQLLNHIATDDPDRRKDLEHSMAERDASFRRHLRIAEQAVVGGGASLDVRSVELAFDRFVEQRDAKVIPTSRDGLDADGLSELLGDTGRAFANTEDALQQVVDEQLRVAENVRTETAETFQRSSGVAALGALLVAGLGVVVALGLSTSISSRLSRLSAFTGRVRAGNLEERSNVGGDDEIGQLAVGFNEMLAELATTIAMREREAADLAQTQERITALLGRVARGDLSEADVELSEGSLSGIGHSLSEMRSGLRTMTSRINEAVHALSAASVQLQSMAQESSAAASESASGVAETVASVDEVARTAEIVSGTARGVQATSKTSVTVYSSGKQALRKGVDAISEVRTRMESFAERILALSEDVQEVDAVVSTVNELAEQSNVLSLNAAIEAARAGEHGHGFAVVAREMRTLAEQSRAATSTIRDRLTGIRRSTSKVVLAAEEGSSSVDGAMHTISDAGHHIEQLQDVIRESAASAEHIQASAEQQVDGMSQITEAVRSIELAARHGVEGARTLEEATRELNRISTRLQQATAHYRM